MAERLMMAVTAERFMVKTWLWAMGGSAASSDSLLQMVASSSGRSRLRSLMVQLQSFSIQRRRTVNRFLQLSTA